jgi:hypothetical protein
MPNIEQDVSLPSGAQWVQITDDLLVSGDSSRWAELVERFEPVPPHQAGIEAAEWLQAGLAKRKMPLDTYAVHTTDELLGFYAVRHAEVDISAHTRPILSVRRPRPLPEGRQPGLILSSIARARSTVPGFGRLLIEHAIGLALTDPAIVAIFAEPANEHVARMWQDVYHFRPMDKPAPAVPYILWFPIDPMPEGNWP